MTYIRTNVAKPVRNSAGAASPKEPNVTIIAVSDIQTWPARNDKGVLMAGNFILKSGAKAISVYMTSSKIKAPYEGDGDEDSIVVKHKFEGEHPGTELEINEFVQNWMGEPCIIIHGSCADAFRKVAGTKCAPLQLKPSGQDDNDGRKHMLVFEQFAKTTYLPGHYTGAIPENVIPVVDDASLINVDSDSSLILPLSNSGGSIGFDEIVLEHNAILTLIGSGGTSPLTLASGGTGVKVLLINATNWVALDGAVIHLKYFKSGSNYRSTTAS